MIGAAILVPLAETLHAQLGHIVPGIQNVVLRPRHHRHHPAGARWHPAVGEGAIHGIIGPNGAGKTTLFNVINGFLPPDAGSIKFAPRVRRNSPPPCGEG